MLPRKQKCMRQDVKGLFLVTSVQECMIGWDTQ